MVLLADTSSLIKYDVPPRIIVFTFCVDLSYASDIRKNESSVQDDAIAPMVLGSTAMRIVANQLCTTLFIVQAR